MKFNEKTASSVVNSLLRAARKAGRVDFHEAWKDEKGRTCVLDGFRAYCLNAAPRGLSVTWSACTPDPEHAAARAESNNKLLSRVFEPLDAGNVIEMPAPDADAVKAFLDNAKSSKISNAVYDLGETFPAVSSAYLWDVIRLFPAAKWYIDPDPRARMIRPLFIVADEGRACLMPCRLASKLEKKPEETPAAAPVEETPAARPEIVSAPENPLQYAFVIYSRPAGVKRFMLTDMSKGIVGLKKMFAPRYEKNRLDQLKELLDLAAAENPGAVFQVRKLDGKEVVYTAVPTFTPEMFAAMIVA